MGQMVYKTKGVCSRAIELDVEDGIIKSVSFRDGCDGNAKGIASLVAGMSIDDVIERLEGITCEHRDTSCPDQLAKALRKLRCQ